jgi:Dolichyl-phosphate-mannose-protein mannosyltransferase
MTHQRTNPRNLLFLLFGAAAYLYANLFFSPRVPFLLTGDQVFFWTFAQRMLGGARVYQDFFQFTPPGTNFVYLIFFKLFGPNVWVTNGIVLVLGIALTWLCFSIASEIMQHRSALLASVVFLVFLYGKMLNATHHWFSVLLILAAVKVLMGGQRRERLLGAGALLGSAAFFTQTHGAFALFACATWLALSHLEKKTPGASLLKQEALLLLSCVVAWFLLTAPTLTAIGFRQLWHFQVSFVGHTAVLAPLEGGPLGLPAPFSLHALPKLAQYLAVYLLLPVIYPLTLWRCWRQQNDPSFARARVLLLALVGTFLFVEVLFNINWLRLFCVASPGIILLFWNAEQWNLLRRPLIAVVWIVCALFGIRQVRVAHLYPHSILHLPGGTVAVRSPTDEKLRWLQSHTTPGQFFFQAASPSLYLPTGLSNPVFVSSAYIDDGMTAEYTARTINQLDTKRVQFILWVPRFDSVKYADPQVMLLRDYLHSNYTLVQTFSDGETIWERDAVPGHH